MILTESMAVRTFWGPVVIKGGSLRGAGPVINANLGTFLVAN